MTLEEILKQIEERADKATPGPWEVAVCRDGIYSGKECLVKSNGIEIVGVRQLGYPQAKEIVENSDFIAASRTDIPKLLAVIRELVRQRDMWIDGYTCPDEGYSSRDNAELVKILERHSK